MARKLSLFTVLAVSTAALTGCSAASEEAPAPAEEANFTEVKSPLRMAPDQLGDAENFKLWSEYCVGDAEVTKRPVPNYANAEVMEAARQLSRVADHSFALYSEIARHHKTDVPKAQADDGITVRAHEFLGYLCGEFRDRASMVKSKLDWVRTMNYLDDTDKGAFDVKANPWRQMRAADYKPYIALSRSVWTAKQSKLATDGKRYMQVGAIQADTPVQPFSVCETKYMFSEYVRAGKAFDSIDAFMTGYEAFKSKCDLPADEDYAYDFRGDSNIKPNSPESNGMIWFGRTIARQCFDKGDQYAEVGSKSSLSDEHCKQYFKYPFNSRWNAARAGLASWVLIDPNGGGLDSNSNFTVVPRTLGSDPAKGSVFGDFGPYIGRGSAGTEIPLIEGWKDHFNAGSFGLATLFQGNKESMQKAMQLAVDRHTDWYNSGYDDEMPYWKFSNTQAYSPFVASSYEMQSSDGFTSPGVTVQTKDPTAGQYKHWMYVFKVKRTNWFTPETIANSEKADPDFDRVWLDETSFGDTGLANSEHAWDRLGTSLEDENDTILYLRNVPRY